MKISENDIKKILKEKKVLFGSKQAKKALKRGVLEKVIVSNDAIGNEFNEKYKLTFNESSKKLGIICNKPFNVSVIAILKESE